MATWFKDLVSGLVFLEKHGMVHRDLKMSNLLCSADGSVIISDFGKATTMDKSFKVLYSGGKLQPFKVHGLLCHCGICRV